MMWIFIINVRKSQFMIYRNVSVHWNSKSDVVIYFCRINQSFTRIADSKPSQFFFFIFSRLMYFSCVSKFCDLPVEKICRSRKRTTRKPNKKQGTRANGFFYQNPSPLFLSLRKRAAGQTHQPRMYDFSLVKTTCVIVHSCCQGNFSIRDIINYIARVLLK